MINYDTMPVWLQRRVALALNIQGSGRWTAVERAASRHTWAGANDKAKVACLASVQTQLLTELAFVTDSVLKVLV